jgi:hypothetical protein
MILERGERREEKIINLNYEFEFRGGTGRAKRVGVRGKWVESRGGVCGRRKVGFSHRA